MKTNQERFLGAANWALLHERNEEDVGINIRRMPLRSSEPQTNVALFNGAKDLMYRGYSYSEQEQLKGLIVEERDGKAVRVLAGCFSKFYNYGEPSEKKSHCKFVKRDGVSVFFYKKYDGTNIRPYWNDSTDQVEFATRSMPTGNLDEDYGFFDFGGASRAIANEKYSVLLEKKFAQKYSLVFELIHPGCKIITDYGDTKDLILLGGFDLEDDCRELSRKELSDLTKLHNFNLAEYWAFAPNTRFDDVLERLPDYWKGTDQEGTVVTFVRQKDGMPLYRLKIKNVEYLQMLRLMRYCTLKRTRETIESNGYTLFDEMKSMLYENTSMNEELEMAYRVHWDTYVAWKKELKAYIENLVALFGSIPAFNLQKDYAMHVMNDPQLKEVSSFMFEFRKIAASGCRAFYTEKLEALAEKVIPLGDDIEES